MSLRELMENLAHLVDEHTSYFKSNLEGLPAAERKVYVTLADLWRPSTAREVAEAARIDVNKASGFLSRLMHRGAVGEARKEGRTIWYQVSERLYNIYHLLRKHGGEESRVRWFVEFMIEYYDHDSIIDVVRTIADEACDTDPGVRRDHFFVYSGVLTRLGNDERARKILAATNPRFFQMEDAPDFIKELPRKFAESTEHKVKRKEIGGLLKVAVEHWRGNRLAEAEEVARQALRVDSNEWATYAILTSLVALQERHDEAKSLVASLEAVAPDDAPWEFVEGLALSQAGELEKARNAYERALQKKPNFEPVWVSYGSVCEEMEDWVAAERAYLRTTSLNENNADAWKGLYRVQALQGKSAEAGSSARTALRLDPEDSVTWGGLAMALLAQEQFTDECEEALQKAFSSNIGGARGCQTIRTIQDG
jgi:Flp pilus assembly protein TadD